MKLRKIIFMGILFLGMLFYSKNITYATTINSLDYNIEINDNGNMDVIETWNITLENDNMLTKNIMLSDKDNVINVKVRNLINGNELKQIEKSANVPSQNDYYQLKRDDNIFEIGWGVEQSNSTQLYQISYTVENAINVYVDCNELNMQIIDNDNMNNIENITGAIKLPQNISNENKLKYWIHGTEDYEIRFSEENTILFNINNVDVKNRIDFRFITKEKILNNAGITEKSKKWSSIIAEEDEKNTSIERIMKVVAIIIMIIFIIVIVVFFILINVKKSKKEKLGEDDENRN